MIIVSKREDIPEELRPLFDHLDFGPCSSEDKDAWLAWRRTKITSTDVASLLGKNPYRKPDSVIYDKLFGSPPIPDNEHMARGRRMEPILFEELLKTQKGTGLLFTCGVSSKENPRYATSPDGIIIAHNELISIEVKCPTAASHRKGFGKNRSRDSYLIQAKHHGVVLEAARTKVLWGNEDLDIEMIDAEGTEIDYGKIDEFIEQIWGKE